MSLFGIRLIVAMVTLLAVTESKYFHVTSWFETCIMLDIEFTADFRAFKDGQEVAGATVTADDSRITVKGSCGSSSSDISLNFQNSAVFEVSYEQDKLHPVSIYRAVEFTPDKVFGKVTDFSQKQTFRDPRPVYLSDVKDSYLCNMKDEYDYLNATEMPEGYSFTVNITVMNIQTQGFGISGAKYGKPEECAQPTTTTTVPSTQVTTTNTPAQTTTAENTTVTIQSTTTENTTVTTEPTTTENTTATTEPITTENATTVHTITAEPLTTKTTAIVTTTTSTVSPQPYVSVNHYDVRTADNIVCISLQGALTLKIQYPLNTSTLTLGEAVVPIPKGATNTGNCDASDVTQTLNILFLSGWSLNITFSKNLNPKNGDPSASPPQSYGITDMKLTFILDEERFPDCALDYGTKYVINTTSEDPNFPVTSDSAVSYRCNSDSVISISDNAHVDTQKLQFKAFNQDSSDDFKGKETVCSADNGGGSSGLSAGAIVGIVLVVLVVVGLVIAGIVVYTRSRRRAGYVSVN